MNRNRHTHDSIITREATELASEKSPARKKQIIGFNGKGKLEKKQLLDIGKKISDELKNKTLSLADLRVRIELLIDDGEDV